MNIAKALICGALLLHVPLHIAAKEWCKAAPEYGRAEYGVVFPRARQQLKYMVEVVPSSPRELICSEHWPCRFSTASVCLIEIPKQ